ncbi:MAG TPA: oligosaccharide flippase family protein, partial [Anaerolineae bacterium]
MDPSPDSNQREAAKSERHEEPLAFRAVRGGLWLAVSSYFNIGFGFIATLILTRLLAPEHFGIIALASFFFWLINIQVKIGLGFAVARHREITGELVGTFLGASMLAGTANLFLATIAAPILFALNYSSDVIIATLVLASVSLIDSATGIPGILLDQHLHFKQTSLVTSIVFPISYLPAFYLALNRGGYWSLLAQNATFAILQMIGLWWMARRILPEMWQVRWRFDRQL